MFKAVSGFNGIPSHNGAGGFEGVNDGALPANTIINRPFDGNLDETVNGLDVNYFDNSTDTPIFDSDGWLLQSSNDGRGIAAVSTAQVDNECFLGEFNSPTSGSYTNGVFYSPSGVTRTGFLTFTSNGGGQEGKYFAEVSPLWEGARLTSSEGVTVRITLTDNAQTFRVLLISKPSNLTDEEALDTFQYPNRFKIDFSPTALSLSVVKQLRADVGDGSTWIDFPVNDYERQIIFKVNGATDQTPYITGRYIDADNSDGIYCTKASLVLKVNAITIVNGIQENLSATIPNYNGSSITLAFKRRSSGNSELVVENEGVTYTDAGAFNQDAIQSDKIIFGNFPIDQNLNYDFTVIDEKIILL